MSAWEGKTNLDPYFTSKNTTTMEHRPHGDEISEGLKGAGKSPEDQAWVLRAGRESTSRKRKGGRCFTTGEEPPWGATGARKPGTSKGASRASASKQPGTRTRPPEWAAGPGGRCGGGRAQGREQALEGETCPPGPRPAPQTSRTHGGVRGQHPASACRRPDALMGWGGVRPWCCVITVPSQGEQTHSVSCSFPEHQTGGVSGRDWRPGGRWGGLVSPKPRLVGSLGLRVT